MTISRTLLLPALLLAAPLPALRAEAPPFDVRQLVGTWEGTDEGGIKGSMTFRADGTAQMVIDGEPMVTGIPGTSTLRFQVDASHDPYWLDFIILDAAGQEQSRLKTLLRIDGPDQLTVWQGQDLTLRPVLEKVGPGDAMRLTRKGSEAKPRPAARKGKARKD